jgi:CRISPR-associated endonuclease/helicase Cas3
VDHKKAGVLALSKKERFRFLGMIIDGHHGGLPDRERFTGFFRREDKIEQLEEQNIFQRFEKDTGKSIDNLNFYLPDFIDTENYDARRIEFFLRMLFSCLVDADFLDTESHFDSQASAIRGDYEEIEELWRRYEESQKELIEEAPDTHVNRVRKSIYDDCLSASVKPSGFFSLTVPTGGGKTRSGMGFALKHAIQQDMDRVIVVIPYTSIIEQNSDVYRDIFGDENVVEHHSSLSPEKETERNRLFSENWDAPVVVTTTVQFFESLFASRPSRCRKLHNVANSVVILDEIQTLPPKYIESILDVLKQLTRHYDTSIVFSTATQPAFGNRKKFPGIDGIREIVEDPANLYKELKRTRFHVETDRSLTDENIVERFASYDQVLGVFNTVDRAQEIFRELEDRISSGIYHLSAGMCGAHRREVLSTVRKRLDDPDTPPCRLVSTQCVEAGVDLDFPVVYRALGPMDSIVQAAGRCNREGDLEAGEVYLIQPEDQSVPPGTYRTGKDVTQKMINQNVDFHSPDVFRDYFRDLYSLRNLDKNSSDGKSIQEMREDWQFERVADTFRLIEQVTVPVIVPYKGSMQLLDDAHPDYLDQEFYRNIQPYIVNLSKHKFDKSIEMGLCSEFSDELYRWDKDHYDEKSGIKFEKRGALIG